MRDRNTTIVVPHSVKTDRGVRRRGRSWRERAAEGSKPPSVRPDIRLSVRADVRTTRRADLHRRGSPFHPFPSVGELAVRRRCRLIMSRSEISQFAGGAGSLETRSEISRPATLGGLASSPLGSVRAPHRSARAVSLLFECQPSPTPGLHPVACPDGGGTFLMRPTGVGLPLPSGGTPTRPKSRSVRWSAGFASSPDGDRFGSCRASTGVAESP